MLPDDTPFSGIAIPSVPGQGLGPISTDSPFSPKPLICQDRNTLDDGDIQEANTTQDEFLYGRE